MERELHLIELYVRQFEEARRLLQEETERAGSTELDGLLEDMDAKWNTLFRLYEIVINGSAIEQLEARVGAMETSRSRYIRTRKVAEKKKERDPNAPSTSGLSNTTHRVLAAAMAKLTAAKVPTFSGEMVKWQEFWGVFKLTVHQQWDLPVLEKFIKLKGALSREAASIIKGLPLTAANYVAAVGLLTQHYGSTEVIIQENFRYLHNMPVVPPGDFAALKQFLINSEVRIRSLESLGVPRESYATPFVSFLVDRLPKYTYGVVPSHIGQRGNFRSSGHSGVPPKRSREP